MMERKGKLTEATPTLLLTLLLVGIVFAGGHLVAAAAGAPVAQKKLTGKRLAAATALFETNCARCHGADGRGQTAMGRAFAAPNLTDSAWWKKTRPTDQRLANSIRHGRGQMPGFGQQLSKSDIAALVAFVRTFDGK